MSRRGLGLAAFLLLAFGSAWAVEIGLVRRYAVGSTPYVVIMMGVMLIPGLSALLVRLLVEREGFGDAGLRWGRGRYYLAGWLLPPVFGLAAFALSVVLRQGEYDPWMTELMARMQLQAPEMRMPPLHLVRIYVIVGALTQAVAINTVFAFGEEFGWRGYLLMRLLPLGRGRALVLSGAIWGVWHAPIILQGHNYPDHPALGVPLMVGFCILMGVFLGWLRLASGSVFPTAVGHASVNGPGMTPLAFLRSRNDITTGLTGLLGQAVVAAFVLLLWGLGALREREARSTGGSDGSESVPEPGD